MHRTWRCVRCGNSVSCGDPDFCGIEGMGWRPVAAGSSVPVRVSDSSSFRALCPTCQRKLNDEAALARSAS